jgi:hypothetical protein
VEEGRGVEYIDGPVKLRKTTRAGGASFYTEGPGFVSMRALFTRVYNSPSGTVMVNRFVKMGPSFTKVYNPVPVGAGGGSFQTEGRLRRLFGLLLRLDLLLMMGFDLTACLDCEVTVICANHSLILD